MLPNNSVLYYPTIEITNYSWLKSSLLLWDHIYRIVPSTYSPKDNNIVKACVNEDIIRPVHLEENDFYSASQNFLKFMENIPFTPAGLDSQEIDRLHIEKIDGRLYPLLEAESVNYDSEGFLHIRRELARGYMFYLANSISERRNLSMATDNRDAWAIMPYFNEQGNFDEQVWNPKANGFYTSLLFTDILPANIEQVEIKEIINFISKRKDERDSLRLLLKSFAQEISKCESPDHLLTIRKDFQKDFLKAKNDFRKSCNFFNEDVGYSLLNIGVPVGLSLFSVIENSNDPYQPISILPSILIGAIAAYLDFRKVKNKSRNDSPYSFLIDMDKELLNKNKIPLYWRSFEEFVND